MTHSGFVLAMAMLGLSAPPPTASERNPDIDACRDENEGDPCQRTIVVKPSSTAEAEQHREPGVCRKDRCCELDYSRGSPPESVCSDCLVCKPGSPDTAPTKNTAAAEGDAARNESPRNESPRAGDGNDPPATAPKTGGCAIALPGPPLWALLPLVGLRRRRASSGSSRAG